MILDGRLDAIRHRQVPEHPEISVVFGVGDVFGRGRGRRRIGYTMLEVDGFPASWVRQANEVDEVWVPASFNREALLAGGVTRPVRSMPLGVDTRLYHPGVSGHPNPHGHFVFLASFEWGERKSPEILLTVFNRVFRRDEPVVLLCKVNHTDPHVSVRERLTALPLREAGGRIAFLFNRELPDEQLPTLYRSADCFVSASRGEGWDLPLLEAMACGLPTIATAWGAHLDFHGESVGYPLAIRGLVPALSRHPWHDGFRWADPDTEHLAFLMRHVYENRDEARSRGGRAAAEVEARWTWSHAAKRIAERLEVYRG
jgi:glycosyltransferase involved in cell wall biosynthesis